ncbi:AraC family transcriptional regulator [Niabella beijingensis]|uniref:AraC family transcriptional regulator n=1 Tax=Niabella beijingensis TaxID=2872700 RepID=UPI001CBC3BAC|nr:AraC family transcriptional regulator [Niabella beijingensis]MBZ4190609.1 AraC family transcriptional regulator [Niabella beijingensis]
MKPHVLKMAHLPGTSFDVRRDLTPLNNRWHCHKEVELIYIARGSGTLLIGDHIRNFTDGTICLIGANVPHYWRFDDSFFEEDMPIDVIAIHFQEAFWGRQFLDLPENNSIRDLLKRAARGLLIHGRTRALIHSFHYLQEINGPYRIISLVTLLSKIAGWAEVTSLASEAPSPAPGRVEERRINDVYEYTMKHFRRKIHLSEIAGVANVSPNSFCRYFKLRTRKTYSRFVTELRIGYVCKLLVETDSSVKLLCYESGFNNFTSFHKCFKQITGMSPLVYQKERRSRTTLSH